MTSAPTDGGDLGAGAAAWRPAARAAATADWPALWPLLQGMGGTDGEAAAERRFRALVERPDWCITVAAVPGGILVGYAAAQDHGDHLRAGKRGRVARLHDLFVAPASRRAGVGTILLDSVIAWARERVTYLQWQAHETDAAPFYERLGHRGERCPQPEFPEFEIAFD